jgi:hypothetical protein
MNNEISIYIIKTLEELRNILLKGNSTTSELRNLSNNLMQKVSIYKDKNLISISVLIYSLYKIFSKNDNLEKKQLISLIDNMINNKNNNVQFHTSTSKLFEEIKKYDKNIDSNILHIIKQGYINKGISLYEHGFSIGNAAEIMGISKWDIMEYLGGINIIDTDENAKIDCRDRLNYTRGLFQ